MPKKSAWNQLLKDVKPGSKKTGGKGSIPDGIISTEKVFRGGVSGPILSESSIPMSSLTLGLVGILTAMVGYLYYIVFVPKSLDKGPTEKGWAEKGWTDKGSLSSSVSASASSLGSGSTTNVVVNTDRGLGPMSDPYVPPLNYDLPLVPAMVGPFGPSISVRGPVGGVPVNVKTSSVDIPYSQVGLLKSASKNGHNDAHILPLMGRSLWNGRDKWQYYTMANGVGAVNTKLPIRFKGRSCTSEYGCDSLSSGDMVHVEGYDGAFSVTLYENALLQYLPY